VTPPAVTFASYCEPVVAADAMPWPQAGRQLLADLAASRDSYALIAAGADAADADRLVERLSADLGLVVAHLGAALAGSEHPPTVAQVEAACAAATVLADLDVLLWPALAVPVLPFLTALARRRPIIAVWPGGIADCRARYSTPGRPDYYDQRLADVVVLHPRTARFPDEVPYEIERIAR
jgi:hypothetical protein